MARVTILDVEDHSLDADDLIRRRTLIRSGIATDNDIRASLAAGDIARIWRGVYYAIDPQRFGRMIFDALDACALSGEVGFSA
ncbi:hypothetical protein [Williamsia sterculiae]|uniref:Uncharacterized protein n=1 Tax=Williamsia sterculiae TaxID=1344003 RepID=A0A1N7GVJ0_9NOCA|nr:hypothetical protein [Williamsia sterculiae]SIS16448.1 hypothetical protein SAMN05445060_3120 [Williamsia sterculiae]